MKILIAGSSGFVGSILIPFLKDEGHSVFKLVRVKFTHDDSEIEWNPKKSILDAQKIEGFDAFINLAGDNISSGRWTEKKKKAIMESRVQATSLLCSTAAKLQTPPKVIINASAVGYYGNRGDVLLDETSELGKGFLAEVCDAWENATAVASKAQIRVVLLRIGVVLDSRGGALKKMIIPFKCCLGGVLGSGNQYMSWITTKDLNAIISFVLKNEQISGPVNAVTPNPVKNSEFTETLGKVLHRPTIIPMPAFVIRFLFGQMGDELLLASTRVHSVKLNKQGYQFRYPNLEQALIWSKNGK